jgi:hypothetical protein
MGREINTQRYLTGMRTIVIAKLIRAANVIMLETFWRKDCLESSLTLICHIYEYKRPGRWNWIFQLLYLGEPVLLEIGIEGKLQLP